jgi:cleavage and polyadenylation specificity factor subunit 1
LSIGGVIILAINSLLYLNQSVPPYGVSLNSITDTSTGFSLKPQPGVCISLDCARAAFVSDDHLVLSLKGGEIYVVSLIVDSMRSIRSFNFDKAARSVITTAICVTGGGYLFLGSRLGNSILLKYTEKADNPDQAIGEDEEEAQPEAKKSRLDSTCEEPSSPVLDDMDELEVYGTEAQSGTELASYTFEVCDSIVNIAPIARIILGEPSFLSEEFASADQLDLELVTCSGFGKNGSLSVLQHSIRPQVVTTFELLGCTDMWTVRSLKQPTDEEDEEDEDDEPVMPVHHSYLILSREDSSIVLHTAHDINELDHSGFNTKAPTVFAGNMADDKYILQVCPKSIHLLEGDILLESLSVDDCVIVGCSLADPYAVLLCSDGSLSLVTVQDILTDDDDNDSKAFRFHVTNHALSSGSHIIACSAYKDVSGLFCNEEETQTVEMKTEVPVTPVVTTPVQPSFGSISHLTADEEDDLLYGDSSDKPFMSTVGQASTQQSAEHHKVIQQVKPAAPMKTTFWCAVCRQNGNLEIYTLPEFQLVMQVIDFPAGLQLLTDKIQEEQDGETLQMGILPVHEILLTGMGPKCDQPYLIAHVDQDLLVYKAFKSPTPAPADHLRIRFRKVEHQLLLREKTSRAAVRVADYESNASGLDREQLTKTRVSSLRVFHNVAGYSGVFVCGHYPHWLFVTERSALRAHPMSIDGLIMSFAPFSNVNCAEGFLYLNKSEELRICVLPTNMLYDTHWPVKQVPLRATPHSLSFHPESKTYAVVASQPVVNKAAPRLNNDDLEKVETIDREERFIYPTLDRFSLQLFSPVNWELIPNTKFDLHDWERLTALKTVRLRSEQTVSRRKSFIAMSTTYAFGEEVSAHGRILLFDVVDVVPEPGKPLTRHKLKVSVTFQLLIVVHGTATNM